MKILTAAKISVKKKSSKSHYCGGKSRNSWMLIIRPCKVHGVPKTLGDKKLILELDTSQLKTDLVTVI